MTDDLKVERITTEEMQSNPQIFEERVHEKIKALLEKYGWTLDFDKIAFDGESHHLTFNAHKKK